MLMLRFRTRLLMSYLVVAILLVAAFSQMALGLMRTNEVVASLRKEELALFEREQQVYRAAWSVELAARRGILKCEQDGQAFPSVLRSTQQALQELEAALVLEGSRREDAMRQGAEGYVAYAQELIRSGGCPFVLSLERRQARFLLDEKLTTAWSDRTRELRLALGAKDRKAQAVGRGALRSGVLLGLLGTIAAGALALSQSRALSHSVALLSSQARQIGAGDFTPLEPMHGPAELRELALALDRMRARLAELDQLKSGFVASVSHDLRTPLARVREALSLLSDRSLGPLNEQQARVVQLAQAGCEREIRMVTSLLDLSRVQSGQPLRRNTAASVDHIVQTVMDDLSFEAQERKVQLTYQKPEQPVVGPMDDPLIERALSNLVSNAISVSQAGQVVKIRCERVTFARPGRAEPLNAVQVSVQDEGPGVPAHAREQIFRPFVRYEVSAGRQGTGLGLTLAREMIVAHGGQLTLLDTVERGAHFSFWIPLEG